MNVVNEKIQYTVFETLSDIIQGKFESFSN